MRTEQIGQYEINCSAVPVPDVGGWAAHLSIYGPSTNPMHRNAVFPEQRINTEAVYASEHEAEEAARQVGLDMIEKSHPPA